eukprot:6188555-Pleurochrysis_carterae.AAC.1
MYVGWVSVQALAPALEGVLVRRLCACGYVHVHDCPYICANVGVRKCMCACAHVLTRARECEHAHVRARALFCECVYVRARISVCACRALLRCVDAPTFRSSPMLCCVREPASARNQRYRSVSAIAAPSHVRVSSTNPITSDMLEAARDDLISHHSVGSVGIPLPACIGHQI